MEYKIFSDRIEINNISEFNAKHILECGQVFRYKVTDFGYTVLSLDQKADIYCHKGGIKIFCKNPKYFVKYFDLDTNYGTIKQALSCKGIDEIALQTGYGIRILNQAPLESIISFIISANNNIPRIKKLIELLCTSFGNKLDGYNAFPTIEQLNAISIDWFIEHGYGYRSGYLVSTIKMLNTFDIDQIYALPTQVARQKLMSLKGVGPKVADCVLLFGFHKTDVFPTDTWIIQLYKSTYGNTNMKVGQINKFYVEKFGELSGYAQQYLFYAKREGIV